METDREAALLPHLLHPNIMTLLETVHTARGVACIFEPAICDLHSCIVGTMPESDTQIIASALFRAVQHIHHRGVIHADIKPENILVFALPLCQSAIRLTDFGSARLASEPTIPGVRRGTWLYGAPEVWEGSACGRPAGRRTSGRAVLCSSRASQVTFPTALTGSTRRTQSGSPRGTPQSGFRSREHLDSDISEEGKAFLRAVLVPDPSIRPTASEALRTGWLSLTRALSEVAPECQL